MFRESPVPSPGKGAFDLSNEVDFTARIGQLLPVMWHEVVPGDSFQLRHNMIIKLAPMLAPVFHRLNAYVHDYFVPYRLLMNPIGTSYAGWEDYITGDVDSFYANEELPYVTINDTNKQYFDDISLSAYLGLPIIDSGTTVSQDVDINVLPFFAYHLIYNEYYRDENLCGAVCNKHAGGSTGIDLVGGDHNVGISAICLESPYHRAYEKDYLRGALPTAYTGAASDVELDLDAPDTFYTKGQATGALVTGAPTAMDIDASGRIEISGGSRVTLDGSSATRLPSSLATIEAMELRRMMAVTRWLEAERRGGTRYIEMLLGVWGVIGDNAELQIPQYIGGGKQPVQISSVLNQSQVLDPTAGVNDGVGGAVVSVDPQSLETGRAIASGSSKQSRFYAKEHGIIMSILSVLPRTKYGGAQLERFWRKADREDFFVPQLQNIGDQSILQSEAGYDATGTDMDDVFGYAPRWSEYKFKNSYVAGYFTNSLDYWHMATIGDTAGAGPLLNQSFIECNDQDDEITRIFANEVGEQIYCFIHNDVRAIRPMFVHDIPK